MDLFGGEIMSLYDSELKVLEFLWEHGELPASKLYKMLEEKIGWSRNTSYTVIKRSIDKGLITRTEPNYICKANISRDEAQKSGISELIHRFFNDSPAEMMRAFVNKNNLTDQDISELEELVKKLK